MFSKYRVLVVQGLAHASILRALPSKDECHFFLGHQIDRLVLLRFQGCRLLQHKMGIRSSETKGANTGQKVPASARKRSGLGWDDDREVLHIQQWVQDAEVQIGGGAGMTKVKNRLDDVGNASSSFQVSDVAFQGPEYQGLLSAKPERGFQRPDFDGVTQSCAGTMQFNDVHIGGVYTANVQGSQDYSLL